MLSGLPTATETTTGLPTATESTTGFPTATESTTRLPTATESTTGFPTATESTTGLPTATESTTKLPTATESTTGLAETSNLDYIKRLMSTINDDEETLLEKTWGFLGWLIATIFTVVLLLIKRWITKKCNQLTQDNTIPTDSYAIDVDDDADTTPQSFNNEDDDDATPQSFNNEDDGDSHSSNPPSPINESQIPLLQYSHTPPSTSFNNDDDDDEDDNQDLGISSRTRGKTNKN
ncbi:uncharacterized protein LOC128172111 [Crassostrea angulata]|uniref:uncharacterized protein LOC128172111 n=1 Tax=Magallana angulata TaxID=2784310 RepID=UPI0022B1408B|nr:uncharacterized protein LOC128172111 [Crassostrea angulata]